MFLLANLPEQPWNVQTLYSILESVVAVHVSKLSPIDPVLESRLFFDLDHLFFHFAGSFLSVPQGVVDVLVESYLALLGLTKHRPRERLDIRLLLTFLVRRGSHAPVDIAATHVRTEDTVVDSGRLRREARLLRKGVLVWQTAQCIVGHIATEALHSMLHSH